MNVPESNWRTWLAKAENDFLNIENNLAAERVPWDTVCFHAQQAVEKLLKAFLVFHDRIPPRNHDVLALLASCVEIDSTLSGLKADCNGLTYYATTGRYPGDLYEPDEKDARDAVSASHRTRSAIMERLPGRDRGSVV